VAYLVCWLLLVAASVLAMRLAARAPAKREVFAAEFVSDAEFAQAAAGDRPDRGHTAPPAPRPLSAGWSQPDSKAWTWDPSYGQQRFELAAAPTVFVALDLYTHREALFGEEALDLRAPAPAPQPEAATIWAGWEHAAIAADEPAVVASPPTWSEPHLADVALVADGWLV
jgi:hypothetical protein